MEFLENSDRKYKILRNSEKIVDSFRQVALSGDCNSAASTSAAAATTTKNKNTKRERKQTTTTTRRSEIHGDVTSTQNNDRKLPKASKRRKTTRSPLEERGEREESDKLSKERGREN